MADSFDPISWGSYMKTRFLHVGREFGHHVLCGTPIVDIETTQNIKTLGRDDYKKTDICCVGIIVDDQIIQIHREPRTNDITQFKIETTSHMKHHRNVHAFNRHFEYYGLTNYLGIDSLSVEEIKPFHGKGWTKDKFFDELTKDGIIKGQMPVDPFHGDATLVFNSWANGDIKSILDHNVVCLLKEYYILKNRDYLYNKHRHKIDAGGWYRP